MSTISELRRYTRNNEFQLGETLVNIFIQLNTAQYMWIVEFASAKQWDGGRIAVRRIVDASTDHRDPYPFWLLHDEEVAIVFDRSTVDSEMEILEIGRSSSVPLYRMEVNLQPVRN